jgi:hypothetical protein
MEDHRLAKSELQGKLSQLKKMMMVRLTGKYWMKKRLKLTRCSILIPKPIKRRHRIVRRERLSNKRKKCRRSFSIEV